MKNSRRSQTTTTQKITVMLSSRCTDPVVCDDGTHTLSEFREKLKSQLERETLLGPGQKVFQVWINEDEGGSEQTLPVWETCMKQVRAADVVVVLYNGKSGWASEPGGIGICHAELRHALAASRQKVRIVQLGEPQKPGEDEAGERDRLFQEYVEREELPRELAKNGEDALKKCKRAVYRAVLEMTRLGARASRADGFRGDSLHWSELNFRERRAAMIEVLCDELLNRPGSLRKDGHVFLDFHGHQLLSLCHAVPAAMSIPAAREMLGQPFLEDYKFAKAIGERQAGPVHIIACHRSVTEAQAIRQLGFPDATVVTPPFGVYVADNVQKIQLVFITNCRDETATREGVQRFFAWLRQTGEGEDFARRAAARRRIVAAILREAPPDSAQLGPT